MSSQAERFGALVVERLKELSRRTDSEIIKAGGPSTSTMTKVRQGTYSPRSDSMERIERACDWEKGSGWTAWDGGDPIPVSAATQDADYVSSPGTLVEGGVSNAEVLRAIREMQDEQRRMSQRLEQLEQRGTESLGGTEGST